MGCQGDRQTWAIIGAALAVHRFLGSGFLEAVYQAALEREFVLRRIPFIREARLPVQYRGCTLEVEYRVDFLCFGEVLVELKALEALTDRERAQVLNYLRASGLRRALLLNFKGLRLGIQRFVQSPGTSE